MGSKIEWTTETWNPVTGCTKVSAGCKNCYAEGVAERFWAEQYPPVGTSHEVERGPAGATYSAVEYGTRPRRFTDVQTHPERLEAPLRWRKPRMVFVNSMSDLFHEDVPDDFIAQVFAVMALAPQHTFQILTKRPERMRKVVRWLEHLGRGGYAAFPLPNVHLGVSVEDQAAADARIPVLLGTPAAVRWVSAEPLLGPVDLAEALWISPRVGPQRTRLDWLVIGGESGPKARPMDLAWARSLVEQARAAGVPVFVKQLGARPVHDDVCGGVVASCLVEGIRDRKGGDIEEFPPDLRVREFPEPRP